MHLKIARGVAELFQGRSFSAVHVSLGVCSSAEKRSLVVKVPVSEVGCLLWAFEQDKEFGTTN